MSWDILYTKHAEKDLKKLDNSQKIQVIKAIEKVSHNPIPKSEGGYGNPLGNQSDTKLSGLLKIKLKRLGIRVVYKIEYNNSAMKIIIISARADNEVYIQAHRRIISEDL